MKRIFFIGIGGIGMSAIARFMSLLGKDVAGYDKVSTPLTDALMREGIRIHFSDDIRLIPEEFMKQESTLVIYTPAIPSGHHELTFFREKGFLVIKRAEALGMIVKNSKGIAVAGTHGKTTVSSMIAHLLKDSQLGCNAFLGGISKNLNSNLLLNLNSEYTVVEADEFDRSFLQLHPLIAVVTSMDADHLDIYKTYQNLKDSFNQFIAQVRRDGLVIYKEGLSLNLPSGLEAYTYSLDSLTAGYAPVNVVKTGFLYRFSLRTPEGTIDSLELGVYGKLNLENATAALAVAHLLGLDEKSMRTALASYSGVQRRFDVRIETDKQVYIDDYAHHPEELKAFIGSVKEALPGKKLTGIFQPHLYTRTRDFASEFAESLSMLDNVILLDIYPAREEPIPGVTSQIIFNLLKNIGIKLIVKREQIFHFISDLDPEVLLTMGAGDIDQLVEPIQNLLIATKK
ncbi:MAG: UDP-N-acetylmuramate--L-alanine ligase [Bacteroidales bacterium]|nr:UDP-N-acetylmuramate--L-alanine ligase [Bacteroidales bacterium]